MIVVQLLGRLGNCMFLFGLGLSVQKAHPNKQVKFYFSRHHPEDTRKVCEDLMEVFEGDFGLDFVQDPLSGLEVLDRDEFEEFSDIPIKDNMVFRWFFQSHKFLDEDLCQSRLGCPGRVREEIFGSYGDLSDHVGVHVRRGDYLGSGYFLTMDRDWYMKCMGMFPRDQKFIVVSDDMEWCRENLEGDIAYADKNSSYPSLTDMYIQSLCRDNIISASSFSWWGAYLNRNPEKKVYAPHRWAAGPDLPRYYTRHMIRIEP